MSTAPQLSWAWAGSNRAGCVIEILGGCRPEEDLGLVPDGASCGQFGQAGQAGQCLGGKCVGEKLTISLHLA